MTLDFSKITFLNDFCYIELPSGRYLALNKIDESLAQGNIDLPIKAINIGIFDGDDNYIPCTNVIGMFDSNISISTKYKEFEGQVMNGDNIMYCEVTINEDV